MWSFFNTVKNVIYPDELTVKYAINKDLGANGSMTCSPDNVRYAYEHIERIVAFRLKYADLHQVSINVNGKLNSETINIHFDNFTDFKNFLISKKLLMESTKLAL